MHLSFGTLYTAKNEFCSSDILFSSLAHFFLYDPFSLHFWVLGLVVCFGFVGVFFSFGMGWGGGCLGFAPPHKLLCMGKAKHCLFLVCKTMTSLRLEVDRLRYLKNHLTLSKVSFSSWEPYTSCRRAEGTTLTSPSTPATTSQGRCSKRKTNFKKEGKKQENSELETVAKR